MHGDLRAQICAAFSPARLGLEKCTKRPTFAAHFSAKDALLHPFQLPTPAHDQRLKLASFAGRALQDLRRRRLLSAGPERKRGQSGEICALFGHTAGSPWAPETVSGTAGPLLAHSRPLGLPPSGWFSVPRGPRTALWLLPFELPPAQLGQSCQCAEWKSVCACWRRENGPGGVLGESNLATFDSAILSSLKQNSAPKRRHPSPKGPNAAGQPFWLARRTLSRLDWLLAGGALSKDSRWGADGRRGARASRPSLVSGVRDCLCWRGRIL